MKIWIKNKEGKIEIIADKLTKSSLREEVASHIMNQLTQNVDYGQLDIGNLPYSYNTFECTATSLADIVATNFNTIMHIAFTKKDGTKRILTGYTTGDKDAFGRYYFNEILDESDDQLRLVDPRQLLWVLMYDKYKSQRIEEACKAGIDYLSYCNSIDPFTEHIMFKLKK